MVGTDGSGGLSAALLDLVALLWLLLNWIGYTVFADRRSRVSLTLMHSTHGYRLRWMRECLRRDNRIVDTQIAGTLSRSVTFFASTSIFILAGLLAVLGAIDAAMVVVADLRYAVATTREMVELKLFVLLLVFVYAFFKFTWSLRHFNYLSVMIGAAPDHADPPSWAEEYAQRAARVSSEATMAFNRGLRAYYFGLATLTWVLHPLLFMVATALVVLILYRREFRSTILRALGDPADFDR